jgi:hypothetical protein
VTGTDVLMGGMRQMQPAGILLGLLLLSVWLRHIYGTGAAVK